MPRLYHGKIVDLDLEQVTLPNGARTEFEIVRHPGGAAAVAIDDRAQVCLLRQWRYVVGGWIWELPAGKLDPNETPATTAERELREEAGLVAARWTPLGRAISSPGVFTEVVHLFLAQDLTQVGAQTEAHECLEVHWLPLREALAWADNDQIADAKTVIGLYRAARQLRLS